MPGYLATLAIAAVICATSGVAQGLRVNDLAEMARFSDHPLTAGQQEAFDRFSPEALYFAAFYITPRSGWAAVYSEAATERAALTGGRIMCQALLEAGEGDCILYAVVRPRRGVASDLGDIPQTLAFDVLDLQTNIEPGLY